MPTQLHAASAKEGLTVKVHRGDGSVVLGFNLEYLLTDHLAGLAVQHTGPDGKTVPLLNRVSFVQRRHHRQGPQMDIDQQSAVPEVMVGGFPALKPARLPITRHHTRAIHSRHSERVTA